jgi:hypothetical protein
MSPDSSDEREQERDRPRPKVVDKRTSTRGVQEGPGTAKAASSVTADAATAPAADTPPSPGPATRAGRAEAPETPPSPPRTRGGGEAPQEAADQQLWTPQQEEEARRIADQILNTPSRSWVINVAMTLIDVARIKLDGGDPGDAQLAIDTLAAILNGCAGRLEEAESPLRSALAQLQFAFADQVTKPRSPPQP